MPLDNDDNDNEFSTSLEDEHIWDAHPPPGIEMLGLRIKTDRGSGSMAEYSAHGGDGRLEVAEDMTMLDGENLLGAASAADRPGFEIGEGLASEEGQSEIGAGLASQEGQSEIGHGPASEEGQSEIGDWSPEQGFMMGKTHMGDWSPEDQAHVMGSYAMYGPTEIGREAPFESFMLGPTGMGAAAAAPAPVTQAAAAAKVIETARDNRQPPPVMKAVDVDAPIDEGYDPDVTEFLVGSAMAMGKDEYPLTSQFMQRCGAGAPPRYVRVDTEESYQSFRSSSSPEMRELAAKVAELSARLDAHLADPHAHESGGVEDDFSDLSDDIDDLTVLGDEVDAAEKSKIVEMYMPKRYQGLVTAWREGDNVCASLLLPGKDGKVKICTSLEPIVKCVEEMSRHAAESGAASAVIGALPAMGCVLGAGTIMKEIAAAAPAIVERPEATQAKPFIIRIEPKVNPALCALAMLAMACRAGNAQACDEWARLGKKSPAPVRQAMTEALALAKAVA